MDAKIKVTKPPIAHIDQLNQPITVDSIVAFTWSQGTTVRVGRVTKLTAKKVRVAFVSEYTHNNEVKRWAGKHITDPDNLIVLNNNLEQQLTMLALKGLLP